MIKHKNGEQKRKRKNRPTVGGDTAAGPEADQVAEHQTASTLERLDTVPDH